MSRSRSGAIALWLLFAFVVWNVVFDRRVADAGVEVTRTQILRSQEGLAPSSIEDAFMPRVREAAIDAARWSIVVLVVGMALVVRPRRQSR
jgi:hypothetical protein